MARGQGLTLPVQDTQAWSDAQIGVTPAETDTVRRTRERVA